MNPNINLIKQFKTHHSRSRSVFPFPQKPSMMKREICECGHSINAIGKRMGFIEPEGVIVGGKESGQEEKEFKEGVIVGGKESGQEEKEFKGNQKMSLTDMLNSDISVSEMKKFQRNVIYALNRLMKEAEMENDKNFHRQNSLPV
ncbi:conserved hypothetical protein [Echinococcus multilocularis]|uniref:Uncharacterized protein n=1 Tax=Echinococcus multilocularis TaxID=6211 RepID=A0A068YKV4_ECHMU|nr:conserved hypothetical protein [Echinococcus multilocularis]